MGIGYAFPDEQAAPALTAIPARSSCMTWVSTRRPGSGYGTGIGQPINSLTKNNRIGGMGAYLLFLASDAIQPADLSSQTRYPRWPEPLRRNLRYRSDFPCHPRRRGSCPPPAINGGITSPSRTSKAPTPVAPPSLWAEMSHHICPA